MSQFTNRQVAMLCVLSMSGGAIFSPPIQSLAQPSEPSSSQREPLAETPQPLATPPVLSESRATTRAIGTITGQGTTGTIAKFTGSNAIGNSALLESGGKVAIGTTSTIGQFSATSSAGIGLYGLHGGSSGDQPGVLGDTLSTSANAVGVSGAVKVTSPGATSAGVRGINNGTNGNGYGVYGSQAGYGAGVYGVAPSGFGVHGSAPQGTGVRGQSETSTGVYGSSNGGRGVLGSSSSNFGVQGSSGSSYGVYGTGSVGVYGAATTNGGSGVYGSSISGYAVRANSSSGFGVYAEAPKGTGVFGKADTGNGVSGSSISGNGVVANSSSGFGVYALAPAGTGVFGEANTGNGVSGASTSGKGVVGSSSSSYGVHGASNSNAGIYGTSNSNKGVYGISATDRGVYGYGYVGVEGVAKDTASYAGNFTGTVYIKGNLTVTGSVSKASGSFKIDHPQQPATKYLSHSFVESPDMMNVYNGNATTNSKGEVWVTLPSYFQALNRDFRYQLTPIGQFAQVIVGHEIVGNRFQIKTDKPGVKVSWQVTGIRNDAYARQNRIRVEETKTGADRGKYLYPAGFGAGQEKQIGVAASHLAKR